MSLLPPAQPAYVLRGHAAQIHAVCFMRSNSRLVTGDADGWIVIWSLVTKRPVAVWRAHEGTLLGARSWGEDKLITHGKDYKLIVWKFSEADEPSMSAVLPVDTPPEPRRQPWVLHIIMVNTMNFCSFARCAVTASSKEEVEEGGKSTSAEDELLIAVPNTQSSETVDIFHLPTCTRLHTVPGAPSLKGGMVMAISIFSHPLTTHLTVIAGYESGHAVVSHLLPSSQWEVVYTSQAHTQPILSLDVSPGKEYFITSSADGIIAKHPVAGGKGNDMPMKMQQTGHSGQQGLRMRDDGRIFATAGWDARVRVYESRSLRELAVLKWHKEGCYAVSFADVEGSGGEDKEEGEGSKEVVRRTGTLTVREERARRARMVHWLAVGGKDGKVSLWDIY